MFEKQEEPLVSIQRHDMRPGLPLKVFTPAACQRIGFREGRTYAETTYTAPEITGKRQHGLGAEQSHDMSSALTSRLLCGSLLPDPNFTANRGVPVHLQGLKWVRAEVFKWR